MDLKVEQKPLFEIPPQGEIVEVKGDTTFELIYRHKNGKLYQGDSIAWLKSVDTGTIDLIVADPPYNGLYHLALNNEPLASQFYQQALDGGLSSEKLQQALIGIDDLLTVLPDNAPARSIRRWLQSAAHN